jgi:hypothetical protein
VSAPGTALFGALPESYTMSREWAMPSADTLSIRPIAAFADRWLRGRAVVVDPFARNSRVGTITNDLNPATSAQYHMDAVDFLRMLGERETVADLLILDPPYSPRQIAECYDQVGRERKGAEDTQHARLLAAVRDAAAAIARPGTAVLSFGWNTTGMGHTRGFLIREILLVAHGGSHNDTICMAEVMR